ncbi:zf-TFIIB domain-containing protein [Carboxylicivirga caseinilyticus]|uniref:zf-TFIIB domain-containing protein n=1 Tax=Carboxylicivirga caseinilyticus TaxID=3417572 RepID=UPI003D326822|nr:zf-TFIIB domain-containing protein [Marinilabiliaceae bacterium A049]
MYCPRCNTTLEEKNINDLSGSIQVDTCPSCGGTWFDKGELEQIENVVELSIIEIRNIPKKKEQLEKLKCPDCNLHPTLSKHAHQRDKKVIFDYCEICHGIWLDRGELEAIQKDNLLKTISTLFKKMI